MRQNGFSLIELIIVIAITIILLTVAAWAYNNWMQKYAIESQIRQMYADITDLRFKAMSMNVIYTVRFITANQYSYFADLNNDGDFNDTINGIPESSGIKTLNLAIRWRNSIPNNDEIEFDTKGYANILGNISIPNPVGAAYDCIDVHTLRTNMGVMSGGACDAK